MRNYLKYLSDTIYLFQRKYSLTDNQLKFLLFIGDEKGSFTKQYIRDNMYISKNFIDQKFPELVKKNYIFVFEKRPWNSNIPNMYISKNFIDQKFPELVKKNYIFVFEKRPWNSNIPNKYRATSKTNRLVNRFYNVLEGHEQI
jgi:hypothetical protein